MAWRTHHERSSGGADGRERIGPRHQSAVRGELEHAGWRTTLDYRENHLRSRDGVLGSVEIEWHAEAERSTPGGDVVVLSARAATPTSAWRRLWRAAARLENGHAVAR